MFIPVPDRLPEPARLERPLSRLLPDMTLRPLVRRLLRGRSTRPVAETVNDFVPLSNETALEFPPMIRILSFDLCRIIKDCVVVFAVLLD